MTDTVASEAFSGEQYDEAYPQGYDRHYWHIARGKIVADAVRRDTPSGATTLEVGCGRGHYVRLLRAAGYDAFGCELGSPSIHDEVRDRVWCATQVCAIPAGVRAKVETVLALDVIEHIDEPVGFLASLRRDLPALKSLIITVPARMEIWSQFDEHYGHYRRYDRTMLRQTIGLAGLKTRSVKYIFHTTYAAALVLSASKRQRAIEVPAPSRNALPLHNLLGNLFHWESKLVPGAIYGSSLLAVA